MQPPANMRVYLIVGHTDMRKSINGLSIFVDSHLELDPFSGSLFAFCNRRRNMVKILYWDRNGFCLWHKRLERDRFKWPSNREEITAMDYRQLCWILDGLEPHQSRAHKRLNYSILT